MRALFILLVICVSFVVKTSANTCGSLDIRNNVTDLTEKLGNCTVVAGYLQIVLFENINEGDFDKISFPQLKEITGFLLFYRIRGLRSIGKLFPNLSVIRGLELFKDYALIIYDMVNLQEIGLYSLSAILRGSIRIEKNPMLCYVRTVTWHRLLKDDFEHLQVIALNRDESECPRCPSDCSGGCWNDRHCQSVISTHCHEECIRGCDGPGNDQCNVCRNLRDENRCVSKCPPNKYRVAHLGLCVTKQECVTSNGTWWTFDGQCINKCPTGYKNVSPKEGQWDCEHCGSDCPIICSPMLVDSISAAQQLKGCTFINGSLSIRYITGPRNIEEELEENLGMIEEIDGFLKIQRSLRLRSLNFLKNLRVIHGNELDNKYYSFIVQDNQNLQHLWNWTTLPSLEIRNGTINFHYNPKLCVSEIDKLREVTGLSKKNDSVDLSHSNGDKFACNYVYIQTKVELIGPNEVNLTWTTKNVPDKQIIIGYLIYYIEAPYRNVSTYDGDACGEQGWKTIFVSSKNNTNELNQTITQLEPFTQYAYYVSTAYSTGKGGQNLLEYFTTLSSDPSVPLKYQAAPAGSDSLLISWNRPAKLNGILSHYVLLAYLQEDEKSFIDLRDYCKFPMQEVKPKPVPIQTTTVASVDNSSKDCCKKDNPKPVIETINVFDSICINLDKFGGRSEHSCGSFSYQVVQSASHQKYGESSVDNMIVQKRQEASLKARREIEVKVDGNETKYTLTDLKHYSIYIILLKACNENRTEEAQCSSILMLYQRTGRKHAADDIKYVQAVNIDTNTVDIRWPEPDNPNSVIVSYEIEYIRVERENQKYIVDCITREEHANSSFKYKIRHLPPGNYSVRVRAQSLAGYGNYTTVYVFIPLPGRTSTVLHVVISIVIIVAIIAAVAFYYWYRKKHQLDSIHLITTCNPDYVGYIEDEWEMERDNVKLLQELGQGTFGTVYNGMIKDKQIPCAIKTVHEKADIHDKMEFLNEASVMKSFNDAHHVVRLLGVVSRGIRPLVVMELMARGDLKTFLRSTRDSSTCLTCSEMYRMAAEIADGMAYLAAKKFVHRDLAARNCMVSSDHTVKIGDFGMTRDIYETDYYRKETRGLLPVRWMSPESLADGVFSAESDVWSYGIVLWEIATLAEQPYQGLANEQVLQFVIAKGTLERPLQCPDLLYDIMEVCWKWRPCNRPLFTDIVEKLEGNVGEDFKLVSFHHSREGEEFRMMKRELSKNKSNVTTMPAFTSRQIAAHWSKDGDESTCYVGNSSRSVGPSSSYQSSNEFMAYPLSSS